MTLLKSAFCLPHPPFYPTLRRLGSGRHISLTDVMNFPSVHILWNFIRKQLSYFFFLSQFMLAGHSQPVPSVPREKYKSCS